MGLTDPGFRHAGWLWDILLVVRMPRSLPRSRRTLLLALLISVLGATFGSFPAGADDDAPEPIVSPALRGAVTTHRGESQPGDAAEWVPFTGTYGAGCTVANPPGPGGCLAHHPTWAIDFNLPFGRRVRAAGPGVIVAIVRDCGAYGGPEGCNGGAGNFVVVLHGDYMSRYLHLSSVVRRLRVGERVSAGQLLGRVGASGTLDGAAHLHYDETTAPPAALARVEFGKLKACHGTTAVVYPDVAGYSKWTDVPYGTPIRNDGYGCTGHPALPHPPPPVPPVYPPVASLGLGGSPGVAAGDLDGDGDADLAVGVPGADPEGLADAGMVVIVDPDQRSQSSQVLQQRSTFGVLEAGDRFGAAVAVGDYDCDGREDLAIGAPGEDLDAVFVDAGAVTIVGADGGDQLIYAGAGLQEYSLRPGDWLGASLATGDFNGDGCDDLAVGAPGADRAGQVDNGVVWVLFGGSAGLANSVLLLPGVQLGGNLEPGDRVGMALAAGDFDCDGADDLAVGVPYEDVGTIDRAGAVMVTYGGTRPFSGTTLVLGQGDAGLAGVLEAGDLVGASLAAGDHDGDGCDELAVGVPGEDLDGAIDGGAAVIVSGSATGLVPPSADVLYRGQGLRGRAAGGDQAGASVAFADRDCNGRDELVVGAPGIDHAGARNSGALLVHGDSARPRAAGWLRQGRLLGDRAERGDAIGSVVAAGDVSGDGCTDVVAAASGETVREHRAAGAVDILVSGRRRGAIHLTQLGPVAGSPAAGNVFGGASPLRLIR